MPVPDLIKPGDSAWGTDWLGESKVPSPLRASAPPPGCRRMGHTHGFGSTSSSSSIVGRSAQRRDGVWPWRERPPAIGPIAAGTFGYAGSMPLQYNPAFFASPPLAAHTSYAPPPFANTGPFASYANSAQFAGMPLAMSAFAIGNPIRSSWDDNMLAKWGGYSVQPPSAAPPPTSTSSVPPS